MPYAEAEGATLHTIVLVPAFSYANSTTAAISASEVSGVPVMQATIVCPDGPWMEPGGPSESATRRLMDLSTTVLPVLGEGQGAEVRRLLEVTEGLVLPSEDAAGWRRIAEIWGEVLRAEVEDQWKRRESVPRDAAGALSFDDALSIEPLEGGGGCRQQPNPFSGMPLAERRRVSPGRRQLRSIVLCQSRT